MNKITALHMEIENFVLSKLFFEEQDTGNILFSDELTSEEIYDIYEEIFEQDKVEFNYTPEQFKTKTIEEGMMNMYLIGIPENSEADEYIGETIIMFSYQLTEKNTLRYYFIVEWIEGQKYLRQIKSNLKIGINRKLDEKISSIAIFEEALEYAKFCFKKDIMLAMQRMYKDIKEDIPKEFYELMPQEFIEELEGKKVNRFFIDFNEK